MIQTGIPSPSDRTPEYMRARILNSVQITKSGCWEWTKSKNRGGYALFRWRNTGIGHRVSFWAFTGTDPTGKCVCHHCDNRICVNPKHLFLGTQADNLRDMAQKGRRAGEKNPAARLTAEDVLIIRESEVSETVLARQYGVSPSTIGMARRGDTWKRL